MSEIEVKKISGVADGPVRFPVYSSAPTGSEFGQIYFDSTDKKFKYYSGNQWTPIAGNTTQPGLGHYYPDDFTALLIQSDHENDSTVFYDASVHNLDIESYTGDVKHKTAVKKIGSSSIYFDGTSDDFLPIVEQGAGSQRLRLGAAPYWTIDFWIYYADSSHIVTNERVMELYDLNGGTFQQQWGLSVNNPSDGDEITFVSHMNGTKTAEYRMPVGWSAGSWFHIAFCRNKDTILGFVNGVKKTINVQTAITKSTKLTKTDFADAFHIGRGYYSDRNLNAYLDEIRISVGIARWTDTFTVY